jgi:hypothetical protein
MALLAWEGKKEEIWRFTEEKENIDSLKSVINSN